MISRLIRSIVRILGLVFLILGFGASVALVMVLFGPNGMAGQSLGQVWFQHDPFAFLEKGPSIQLVQVFFERKLMMPPLWSPGITTLLNWSSWLALGTLAVSFGMIGFILFKIPRRR